MRIREEIQALPLAGIKLKIIDNIGFFKVVSDFKSVNFALSVPQEYKVQGSDKKIILRELGKKIGLPPEIVNRPKKAFQYSTGIQEMIAKMY